MYQNIIVEIILARNRNQIKSLLTFIVVLSCHGEHRVLNVFVFVDFGLVQRLVKVRRVVVLVGNANPYELGHCK